MDLAFCSLHLLLVSLTRPACQAVAVQEAATAARQAEEAAARMADELIRAEELEAQQAGQASQAKQAKQRGKKARQKRSKQVMRCDGWHVLAGRGQPSAAQLCRMLCHRHCSWHA